jgi:hypothetical protein
MPRTVVPATPERSTRAPQDSAGGARGDDLPTKLVKYVPAEALAFFVPAAAAIGSGNDVLLIIIVAVGAIGTAGWLWYNASSLPAPERPLVHFYALAVIAFLVWALATAPNVAAIVRLDTVTTGVILAIGVFLIPLVDGILERRRNAPA